MAYLFYMYIIQVRYFLHVLMLDFVQGAGDTCMGTLLCYLLGEVQRCCCNCRVRKDL